MRTPADHGAPTAPCPLADVVVPTVGRPSLAALLARLAEAQAPLASVTVVDDRPAARTGEVADLLLRVGKCGRVPHRVLATGGRGPATARNAGWRAGRASWVVFLDDDVVLERGWGAALAADLAAAGRDGAIGAVRARLTVPLPEHRRPTDWERQVHALSRAPGWLTADLAVRRSLLEQVGGLDERFPRAYREDTDLELRAYALGWADAVGHRSIVHPVGPADRWTSVRRQRGNADDVLLGRIHGPGWRERVGERPGAFRRHVATAAAGALAAGAWAAGRGRLAAAATGTWAALTALFAWSRVAPGPRDRSEVVTVALTSAAIPPVAVYHRLAGHWRWRRAAPLRGRA